MYARALVRTVFGRPKAGMFSGGTGPYPGAGTHLVLVDPINEPTPLNEGPCRLGFTRAGGARIKGYGLQALLAKHFISVGVPAQGGNQKLLSANILAQELFVPRLVRL